MTSVAAQQGSAQSLSAPLRKSTSTPPREQVCHAGSHAEAWISLVPQAFRSSFAGFADLAKLLRAARVRSMRLWSMRSRANWTSAVPGASGRQLAHEEGAGAEADNRAQDFKDDIDLDFLSVNRTGSPGRQETQVQRAVDVIAMVDQLIPGGAGAGGGEAQPNQGQTNDLRGAGGQFSK
ncbi:hypothetical protein SGCOL_003825 [Colletotrichum sp. CLE4]